jgi:hypothetical protein
MSIADDNKELKIKDLKPLRELKAELVPDPLDPASLAKPNLPWPGGKWDSMMVDEL